MSIDRLTHNGDRGVRATFHVGQELVRVVCPGLLETVEGLVGDLGGCGDVELLHRGVRPVAPLAQPQPAVGVAVTLAHGCSGDLGVLDELDADEALISSIAA
jgi:hypothetical protein